MTAPHWDHNVHGPAVLTWPNGYSTVEPDCTCPLDCHECSAEGVDRPDLMDVLVRISQGPHPNPGDER